MDVGIAPVAEKSIPLHEFYSALGHAIRYDIVRYLGSFHRAVQYTELVEWLQIKPGSFYFHIKKLGQLVAQDEEKRFYLTQMGKTAYQLVQSGEKFHDDAQKANNHDDVFIPQIPKRFSSVFFGEFIRRRAFTSQFNLLVFGVMVCQLILLDLSQLGMIPFYLDGDLYFGLIGCLGEYLASILVIWLSLEIITRYFSIKGFSRELLSGIPLALLPLFLYPAIIILSRDFFILATLLANPTVSILVIFILQIITAVFVIQLLQVIKTVKFERALIPVFIVLYGFSILSLVISTIL
ncbi:MAG: winged helix-turn-helix domain-containing protein [Candidatus Heimdallarchaeota archaeon]